MKDGPTRAPDGACPDLSSDATDTPGDPPPLEAYDDLPFEEQYDGDEGEPIQDIEPDLTATEEVQDRHAKAAPPAPVEDDDYIPFHLAYEDEKPDRLHGLPVTITETERIALEAIYDSTVRGRTDGFQHWAELRCADPFDDGGERFKNAVAVLAAAGLAFHEDGLVTITRQGVEALAAGEAKPITHKPVITDDDFIPF